MTEPTDREILKQYQTPEFLAAYQDDPATWQDGASPHRLVYAHGRWVEEIKSTVWGGGWKPCRDVADHVALCILRSWCGDRMPDVTFIMREGYCSMATFDGDRVVSFDCEVYPDKDHARAAAVVALDKEQKV